MTFFSNTLRKNEYEAIFATDKSYKVGFLYLDEDCALVGDFMMQDAYITGINHANRNHETHRVWVVQMRKSLYSTIMKVFNVGGKRICIFG